MDVNKMKKIAIGNDHAGFELKTVLVKHLVDSGYEVKDFGSYNLEKADYPDYAHKVSKAIEEGQVEIGILICGSANGIAMSANKHQGIRAAICWSEEIAQLARLHNNANIIAVPARFITTEEAIKCLDMFINTSFEGGRHESRVKKISC